MSSSTVDLAANIGPRAIAVCAALLALSSICVAIRVAARVVTKANFYFDDYLIFWSLFLVCCLFADIVVAVQHDLGRNILYVEETKPINISNVSKALMACEIMYTFALTSIKFSILFMYSRLFPTIFFRRAAIVLGSITVCWCIAIFLLSIFECTPVARAWDKTIPGTCVNQNNFFIGNAIPNIVSDIAILVLPAREVWKLQITTSQKMGLTSIFMLGALVVVISIVRLVSLIQLSATDGNNITYDLTLPWIWTTIEPCVGIISACLPTFRPLIRLAFPGLFRSRIGANTPAQTAGQSGGDVLSKSGTESRRWNILKVKDDDGTGSFERLNEAEASDGSAVNQVPGLTPKGYQNEYHVSVGAFKKGSMTTTESDVTRDRPIEEFPLNQIHVKKEMNWRD